MDKLEAMVSFVRIVDAGSLTAADDALDVSQPSMVRQLAARVLLCAHDRDPDAALDGL